MPVYNCRQWIREAVQSVLAQTDQDFELIIVDDCSTDGSVEEITDLIADDLRIKLIRRTQNGNAAVARNTGLEASSGELIAFLDADDFWEPTRLSAHSHVFDAYPETSMVFSDFRGFGGDVAEESPYLTVERNLISVAASDLDGPWPVRGTTFEIYKCRESLSTFISLNYNLIFMHSVTLSRRALIEQPYWFPTHLKVCEDLEFFLRVLESGPTVFLPEVLAWYRRRAQSLTNQEESFFRGMLQFHVANLDLRRSRFTAREIRAYKSRISQLRTSLAWQLRLRRAFAESRDQYWLAFCAAPTLRGARMLASSLIPGRLRNMMRSGSPL